MTTMRTATAGAMVMVMTGQGTVLVPALVALVRAPLARVPLAAAEHLVLPALPKAVAQVPQGERRHDDSERAPALRPSLGRTPAQTTPTTPTRTTW